MDGGEAGAGDGRGRGAGGLGDGPSGARGHWAGPRAHRVPSAPLQIRYPAFEFARLVSERVHERLVPLPREARRRGLARSTAFLGLHAQAAQTGSSTGRDSCSSSSSLGAVVALVGRRAALELFLETRALTLMRGCRRRGHSDLRLLLAFRIFL